jgi:RimJ/RimL family protein N-acetyltransferase
MFEQEILAGKWVHLTAIDPEEDAGKEAAWTANPHYRLLMEYGKNRGWTPTELKKYYETHLKDSDEHRNEFHFGIRANADKRFVGVFSIPWVGWSHSMLQFRLGFGSIPDLQNWGVEALQLALGYMFGEMNMHLVTMHVPQFCTDTVEAAENAGMRLTGRRREVVFYNGRHWASLWFSLLRPDWMKTKDTVSK